MTGKSSDRRDVRFTEDQFRTIMARAQDLDQRWANGLSEDDVRDIAGELGISARAISKALEESRSPTRRPARSKGAPAGLGAIGRNAAPNALIGVLLGLAAGLSVAFGLPGEASAAMLVGAYTVAGAAALIASGDRKRSDFQLANAGLWCAFGAGIYVTLSSGPSWDELILMTWVWGTTSAVGGELLMRLREWWRRSPDLLSPIASMVRRIIPRPRIGREGVERDMATPRRIAVDTMAGAALPAGS
jgi:hypothetical protein